MAKRSWTGALCVSERKERRKADSGEFLGAATGGEDGIANNFPEVVIFHDSEAGKGRSTRGGDPIPVGFRGFRNGFEEGCGALDGFE
ncbi:MAG: hypothetical protein RL648_11, partial [Verrucomicrobiota bacterium]